jgi:UDP-N-acetylmuramoyl-tripeptide--D-alanyl-D-alanine ligase
MWPCSAKYIYEIVTNQNCSRDDFSHVFLQGISLDSRRIQPHEMFVAIKGDNFDGHSFLNDIFQKNIRLALVDKESKFYIELSEENKTKCIAVNNVLNSLRSFAKVMRQSFQFPIIGIGGSNGKTTTKEILYSMLLGYHNKVTKTDKSENGYLGLAVSLLQESHKQVHPPHSLVLEIGIDDIGAMEQHIAIANPQFVLLTALGPEHLEHLKNWETAVKEELILFSQPHAIRIWQLCDPLIEKYYLENVKSQGMNLTQDYVVVEKFKYSEYIDKSIIQKNISLNEIIWEIVTEEGFFSDVKIDIKRNNIFEVEGQIFRVPLPGKHNAANFSLALAAAYATGININEIKAGFNKFVPPPMRSAFTALPNGVLLYNDSYNSSPLSLNAALKVFDRPEYINQYKILILGDMLDLGEESNHWHESLISSMIKLKEADLCLYGSAMYSCYKLLLEIQDKLLKENGTRIFWLDSKNDPAKFLECVRPEEFSLSLILVKGSRGMRLERFVKVLEEKCKSL